MEMSGEKESSGHNWGIGPRLVLRRECIQGIRGKEGGSASLEKRGGGKEGTSEKRHASLNPKSSFKERGKAC